MMATDKSTIERSPERLPNCVARTFIALSQFPRQVYPLVRQSVAACSFSIVLRAATLFLLNDLDLMRAGRSYRPERFDPCQRACSRAVKHCTGNANALGFATTSSASKVRRSSMRTLDRRSWSKRRALGGVVAVEIVMGSLLEFSDALDDAAPNALGGDLCEEARDSLSQDALIEVKCSAHASRRPRLHLG